MKTEIIVAIIGAIAVIVAALIGLINHRKEDNIDSKQTNIRIQIDPAPQQTQVKIDNQNPSPSGSLSETASKTNTNEPYVKEDFSTDSFFVLFLTSIEEKKKPGDEIKYAEN